MNSLNFDTVTVHPFPVPLLHMGDLVSILPLPYDLLLLISDQMLMKQLLKHRALYQQIHYQFNEKYHLKWHNETMQDVRYPESVRLVRLSGHTWGFISYGIRGFDPIPSIDMVLQSQKQFKIQDTEHMQ
jgi:hypothetical protein